MGKPRSQRLQVVLLIAEREEQGVAIQLEQMQQQINQQYRQLAQLKNYTQDYSERINRQRQGVPIDTIISYRHFLQQLSRTEDEQNKAIAQLHQRLKKLSQLWREKHQRRKSIENLIERYRQDEQLQLSKREQRELDELTSLLRSKDTPPY
jgi:flagellar protein FliJ